MKVKNSTNAMHIFGGALKLSSDPSFSETYDEELTVHLIIVAYYEYEEAYINLDQTVNPKYTLCNIHYKPAKSWSIISKWTGTPIDFIW